MIPGGTFEQSLHDKTTFTLLRGTVSVRCKRNSQCRGPGLGHPSFAGDREPGQTTGSCCHWLRLVGKEEARD